MMNTEKEYRITGGPSWADLQAATFHGSKSPHKPSIQFTVEESPNQGLPASKETIQPVIRLIGAEDETGTVFMNRCDYVDPTLVWSGVKDTGSGIALSRLGFGPYTRPKSFHIKHN